MFSTFSDSAFNPWTGDEAAYGLQQAITLCEKTGHIGRKGEIFAMAKRRLKEMKSQKMMDMQQAITHQTVRINRVNFEIQRRVLYHESKDIIDEAMISKKCTLIKELVNHMQSVVNCKSALVARLHAPHKTNLIKMEEQFHRLASEFYCMVGPLLSDLAAHLEDIKWINTSTICGVQLDSVTIELSTVLATLQTHFQVLDLMSQCVFAMHGAEDSLTSPV